MWTALSLLSFKIPMAVYGYLPSQKQKRMRMKRVGDYSPSSHYKPCKSCELFRLIIELVVRELLVRVDVDLALISVERDLVVHAVRKSR